MDPCWRSCLTPKLACKDGDMPCYCRAARQTSLLADTITCIRQTCTANRPFNPTALLTPFTEQCRKPIPANKLANINALAAQDGASPDASNSPIIAAQYAGNGAPVKLAAAVTSAEANVISSTYVIGIANNAKGEQETFTFPAVVGASETVYGSPVTTIDGTVTPTNVITMPFPTLPVGYFFPTSRAGVVSIPPLPTTSGLPPNVGVTTLTSAIPVGTPQAGDGAEGGTLLASSEGMRRGAKSSLGLMVVLLVGVMWF
ncbi:MAG: hypothetical protein Q9168_005148 [Polycauliona sp. 1 TL-2023]